jgi:hypothetical protein
MVAALKSLELPGELALFNLVYKLVIITVNI